MWTTHTMDPALNDTKIMFLEGRRMEQEAIMLHKEKSQTQKDNDMCFLFSVHFKIYLYDMKMEGEGKSLSGGGRQWEGAKKAVGIVHVQTYVMIL